MFFLKLAWRNLWRNRRRTLITMASIVFAVLLSILMNSVKEGVLYKMQENMVSFYSGAIQIHQNGYWEDKTIDETLEDNPEIRSAALAHPKVNGVIGRLESFALAASENNSKGCMVVGVEPEAEAGVTRLNERVIRGNYLQGANEGAMVSEELAAYLRLDLGDTLVLIGQGYHGVNAAGKYPITAILHFASPELNKRMVYLSLPTAQWLYGAENRLTSYVLSIANINKSGKIAQELNTSISDDYEVMNWQELLPELDQVIEGERAENMIFLFVLYLLISFGIFGTIVMMTMERRFEFGVLMAIGMRRTRLSIMAILENMMISLLGAAIGMIITIPVVAYFHNYPIQVTGELAEAYENYGFEPIFYFSAEAPIFYSQAIVVLVVALVLSVYPVLKIRKMEPVAAMRG